MGILATKLKKNVIKANEFKNLELSFHLKNISRNEIKYGCSGFIKNEHNGKIVYVNSDTDDTPDFGLLYRTAPLLNNYSGHGSNRFGNPDDEVTYLKIIEELARDPQ